MNRLRAIALFFGIFFLSSAALAEKETCQERCQQFEACVYGRCVPACNPACREGTMCLPNGECAPKTLKLDQKTEEEVCLTRGRESRYSNESVFVDVGGSLFTGFQLGYEWGTTDAFVLRGTLMNLGFANYAVDSLTANERFEFGFGTTMGYRRYEHRFGSLRGFYYGGGGLYQAVQSVSDLGYARTTHWIGHYGEFGYRWVFGSLLFGFGPSLWVRTPLVSHFSERTDGTCVEAGKCESPTSGRFEGMLSVEIGFLR